MTDKRSFTLPLCVLAAGAVHGLCVAAMLPMLITLPGPGSVRPAMDAGMIRAPLASKSSADPVTTAALPEASNAVPRSASAAQPTTAEVPPDDTPQQIASPAVPARTGIEALTPEPLSPTLAMAPSLGPSAPEEVMIDAADDITASITPVEAASSVETLNETAEPSAPQLPVREISVPTPGPEVESARADPKEETPVQAVETAKPPAKSTAKSQGKAEKAEPAAKKRHVTPVKRAATQGRRVVRGRPQAPVNRGILSLFGARPAAGPDANAREPAAR